MSQSPFTQILFVCRFFQAWHLQTNHQTAIGLEPPHSFLISKGCHQPKCLWMQLDRPTSNRSKETGDAALSDGNNYVQYSVITVPIPASTDYISGSHLWCRLKGWLWSHIHTTQGAYGPLTSLRALLASTARAWRAPPRNPRKKPSVEATQQQGLWLVRSVKPDAEP